MLSAIKVINVSQYRSIEIEVVCQRYQQRLLKAMTFKSEQMFVEEQPWDRHFRKKKWTGKGIQS